MNQDKQRLDLRCPECSWCATCGSQAMLERLRASGMLRRNQSPEPEEVRELFKAMAPRWTCPQCQHAGLYTAAPAEDTADWPEAARCAECGGLIPAERLEIFPDAKLCVACQQRDDRGEAPGAAEFCPRCGSPMVVRATRGSGVSRYEQVCSDWPRCRGKLRS